MTRRRPRPASTQPRAEHQIVRTNQIMQATKVQVSGIGYTSSLGVASGLRWSSLRPVLPTRSPDSAHVGRECLRQNGANAFRHALRSTSRGGTSALTTPPPSPHTRTQRAWRPSRPITASGSPRPPLPPSGGWGRVGNRPYGERSCFSTRPGRVLSTPSGAVVRPLVMGHPTRCHPFQSRHRSRALARDTHTHDTYLS